MLAVRCSRSDELLPRTRCFWFRTRCFWLRSCAPARGSTAPPPHYPLHPQNYHPQNYHPTPTDHLGRSCAPHYPVHPQNYPPNPTDHLGPGAEPAITVTLEQRQARAIEARTGQARTGGTKRTTTVQGNRSKDRAGKDRSKYRSKEKDRQTEGGRNPFDVTQSARNVHIEYHFALCTMLSRCIDLHVTNNRFVL